MASDKTSLTNKEYWAMSAEATLEALSTTREGLSETIANERLEQFGKNVLPHDGRRLKFKILARQFASPLIIILIVAGIVTLTLQDYKDGIFIFVAVLINAALGFYQENKAVDALSSLKKYVKEKARVLRGGLEREVGVEELVPGDVIKLTAGVRVPADGRVFLSNSLSVDESILTGESLPVSKTTNPVKESASVIDRDSMIYSGTSIINGIGLAAVTATGTNTEFGKIAVFLKEKDDEPTPLQKYIKKLSVMVSFVFLAMAGLLFSLGILFDYSIFEMFLISVAVAVSAVPEGLPIALTVTLAIGVERLAKRNGVVKKLVAAEALGSTTLIITDKTGTLTEGKMELAEIIGDVHKEEILEMALITVEATVENPLSDPEEWRVIGRPLEASIVRAGAEYKLFVSEVLKNVEILERHPFNSEDKFAGVYAKIGSEKTWVYLGAPDVLLNKCQIEKAKKEEFTRKVEELAYGGSRVLGVSVGKKFLGLITFNDPVKKDVSEVVREVASAGVKTVIATGDHKGTALHVAKEIGISASAENVITGEEIQALSDIDLKKALPRIYVFARVTPQDKARIARLYQELGEVVAMTGDGVNDAPALESADVGVALGSGTDIAKDASDLVILDNNFNTIVAAVSEGRRITANLKKIIVYLFSGSLDELFLIGGALAFGLPLPLNALQILWVNFFSDSFPAVALAFEKESDGLKLPRQRKGEELIDNKMKFIILIIGVISSAMLFGAYNILIKLGFPVGVVRTFIFASFSLYTLFLAFSIKSLHKSIFRYNLFDNPYLIGGFLIGVGLTFVAIYVPYFQTLLNVVYLPLPWIFGVVGFGILSILGVELGKFLFRKTS